MKLKLELEGKFIKDGANRIYGGRVTHELKSSQMRQRVVNNFMEDRIGSSK